MITHMAAALKEPRDLGQSMADAKVEGAPTRQDMARFLALVFLALATCSILMSGIPLKGLVVILFLALVWSGTIHAAVDRGETMPWVQASSSAVWWGTLGAVVALYLPVWLVFTVLPIILILLFVSGYRSQKAKRARARQG